MSAPEVRVLQSRDDVDALRDEWNELAAPLRCPVFDHEWSSSCAHTLHEEGDLRVVTVRQGRQLSAVAPMVLERTPGRRLAVLGASALYEPGTWPCASPDALRVLGREVARLGERVLLRRVPRESPLVTHLPAALRGRSVVVTRRAAPCSSVDVSGAGGVRVSKGLRTKQRRAERDYGLVEFDTRHPATGEVDDVLATFTRLEASGWKGRAGSSLSERPHLLRFFRRYFTREAAAGRFYASRLSLGGETAAMDLGIEAHGRMWGLKISYDERFAECAPGIQLVDESIRCARHRGLEAYEFLGSAEPWQDRWRPSRREHAMLALYPFSRRGIAGAVSDFVEVVTRW